MLFQFQPSQESDLESFCHLTCIDESGNILLHTKQATFSQIRKGGFENTPMRLEQA